MSIDVTAPPPDRATEFQPVQNAPETHNGTTLMVEAYAVLWAILLGWVYFMWKKQSSVEARIAGLEQAIERASKKPAAAFRD